MFSQRFLQVLSGNRSPSPQNEAPRGTLTADDLNLRIAVHYGIPSTASVLAFDPIQCLLAIGTLDGRIKVIGDENIEGILVSPKQLPFKNLEFIRNQGFLVSVSNENEIQVWDLEHRQISSSLKWESNITAFSVMHATPYMYVGDEYGMVYVLKYGTEEGQLMHLSYYVPTDALAEAARIPSVQHPVVGLLPQPCSQGNRLLIAFANGLIFLWDSSEDCVVLVRGNRDLKLKGKILASAESTEYKLSDNVLNQELEEKEITSLCWASTDGSVLAVGYIDGDILFWSLSTSVSTKDQKAGDSCNNAIKIQLSSGVRRLPVIFMHWCGNRSNNGFAGKLFAYGGGEVGSAELLTILSLNWSSGIESLKCVGRVDLTLNGAFADMVLSPIAGSIKRCEVLLFVLSNPGQLHIYDDAFLDALMSKKEKETSASSVQYHMKIPTMEPYMTVTKLVSIYRNGETSRILSDRVSVAKTQLQEAPLVESTKWPLTGGVPSLSSGATDYQAERLLIAGYQDGSVRICDATYPALSLTFIVGPKVTGVNIVAGSASVSALDFCSLTLSLAIGSECGMVRLYKLTSNMGETDVNIVTKNDTKVHMLHQENGPQCTAVLTLLESPVSTLQFDESGARLAVGFKCGKVAMLDVSTYSLLFLTEGISESSCPISSLSLKSLPRARSSVNSPNSSEFNIVDVPQKFIVFVMTINAHLVVLDGSTGNILSSYFKHSEELASISMHIIENASIASEVHNEIHSLTSSQNSKEDKSDPRNAQSNYKSIEDERDTDSKVSEQNLDNLLVLLCCKDSLRLYSYGGGAQEGINCIKEVSLSKPCCWTTTFKKDEQVCGVAILYQTGVIEIRSFPNLEVVGESSLLSILRWNVKTNMEKRVCASDKGHVVLINECEFVILSLLAHENDFRIPDSQPCLHDKVLAAAEPSVSSSPHQKKVEDTTHDTFFSGIIKGFKFGKMEQQVDHAEVCKEDFSHLEEIFSCPPYLKPSKGMEDGKKVLDLNIDDINIDEFIVVSPSPRKSKNEKKDKGSERSRLFEGGTSDTKATPRTAEEIKAKYRKSGDVSAVASQARDKLVERTEKLEKLSDQTEELQNDSEDFADLAKQLAKKMEKHGWWNL